MATNRPTKPPAAPGAPPTSNGRGNGSADSVPPGNSRRVRCSKCGTIASAGRKFCGGCGASLWETCRACKTVNEAGEKFCGSCGADLVEAARAQRDRLEATLQQANRLRAECRFDEAIALLLPLTKAQDSEAREYAGRASELTSLCSLERDQHLQRARAVEAESRQLVARHEYAEALRCLQEIPPPLRTESVSQLVEETRACWEEAEQLDRGIREAPPGSLSSELLTKVGRLLELKPNHPQARQWGHRFCQRLSSVARQRLADCRYQEVVKVLDRVPESLRTDEMRAIREKAGELAYLVWDLQSAPIVDDVLVKLARRFRQLAPHDAQIVPLCDQIEHRAQSMAANPGREPVPWKALPDAGPLGCPVVREGNPQRIGLNAGADLPVLRENPGSFAVACGLAIQGLGRAAIPVNLLPDETPLWLRIARWGPKRRPRTAWGIDLGSGSLKAVKLAVDQHQPGGLAIHACDLVEHKKILSQASDEERKSLIDETLKSFAAQNDTDADRICLGLPAGILLLHRLEMPPMEPDKLDAAVAFEARTEFPVPLDELLWDYVVLNQGEAATAEKLDIALVGVRRVLLKDRLARFQSAGLRVDEVQSDCLALHNYVVHNYFGHAEETGRPPSDGRPIGILDIGADAASFIVSSPQSVWLRTVGMGVDRVNKTLVREFRITFAEAEQWKRDPAAASNVGRLFEALQPVYEDFFQEAKSSLQAFALAHPDRQLQRILGLGGGFRLHGLLRYLCLQR